MILFVVGYLAIGIVIAGLCEGLTRKFWGPPPEDCEGGAFFIALGWPILLFFIAAGLLIVLVCLPIILIAYAITGDTWSMTCPS